MHKSILEFDTSVQARKIVMGVHTHVLTDRPEDSDVFYVLSRKPSMPEVVVTGEHEMYLVLADGLLSGENAKRAESRLCLRRQLNLAVQNFHAVLDLGAAVLFA